ncbi:MAG: Calx-beta domain-containing protein [Gammaproteobacteria bacterium]|jgi:hypothetical protein
MTLFQHHKLVTTTLLACFGTTAAMTAQAAISISDATVTEGQTAVLTVSLDEPLKRRSLSIDYTTNNGTAVDGDDYIGASGSVTFRRGEQEQQISISTVDDTTAEQTESFSVVLDDGRGAFVTDGTGVVTITDDDEANQDPTCSIDSPVGDVTITEGDSLNYSATVTDPDDDPVTIAWSFEGGSPASSSGNPVDVVYNTAGSYTTTLDASDGNGGSCVQQTRTITVEPVQQQICIPADPNGISINSTASSGCPEGMVPQVPQVLDSTTRILAINDLGMHCGDLDTRIASILPPFQVLLAQVIQQGEEPTLNPPGVDLFYSAASNPNDPSLILGRDGEQADGSTYKTNFWDYAIPGGTYDPFYPAFNPFDPAQTLTPLSGPPFNVTADVGLPVPNVEALFIGPDGLVNSGDEFLTAEQHAMPGIAAPYSANDPQQAHEFYVDKPFFVNFPFGYVAEEVNWYEGAGIPLAAFDDNGRENAYPLVRVEARNAAGNTLSTVDTVLPISGEASCVNCHADPDDLLSVTGTVSRSTRPSDTLSDNNLPVALSIDDPDSNLPPRVSLEYAADINILRLHDHVHGQNYVTPTPDGDSSVTQTPCDITEIDANGDPADTDCLTNKALVQGKPVVCQLCHYTPALDLAQLGPLTGPEGSLANGRNHLHHKSNSNVMHSHHGSLGVFPTIEPPLQQDDGTITNQDTRLQQLENSCYQCHPGSNVQCLRGAMFNGGMLCTDCHGDMEQVGNDFTANVTVDNPGPAAWDLDGNFYTDPDQPRVPWANEPGCGSCHTGDFNDNLAGVTGTLVNTADIYGNTDDIRLRQAFLTGDIKATPIVPANKRFAEPEAPASFNGFDNPGAGNPQLYRVSTGHGGIMCEGCHGATHAEWPNANPNSNDNLTAQQLQGHTGVIIECNTCHGNTMNSEDTLNGPHGMHPVGNDINVAGDGSDAGPRISFVDGGHEQLAEDDIASCRACHGSGNRRTMEGTVLSVAKKDRRLNGQTIAAGTAVGCTICHDGNGD